MGREAVPRPKARRLVRVALPLAIVAGAASLLAYSARDSLLPASEVRVVPVVVKAAPASSERASAGPGTVIAQAPGWVEPAPYPVVVQALTPGVVDQVLVLEGDLVERGQVVATLIADDASLAVRRARAELAELRASIARARAELVSVEARSSELDEELDRQRRLAEIGGTAVAEMQALQHRQRGLGGEVEAARAAVIAAEAALERQRVAVAEAELMADRTAIRAPVDGVVLTRSIVPGTRLSFSAEERTERDLTGVISIYEPRRLQVRADVALADSGKVTLGTRASMTTEAVPGVTFEGEVTRLVHRADIQRNTLQVKVEVDEPRHLLKPDMLMRVRFLGGAGTAAIGTSDVDPQGSHSIFAAKGALINREGERAEAWVLEPSARGRLPTARREALVLGEDDGEMVRVRSGLRPGDRLIIDPPTDLVVGGPVRARSGNEAAATTARGQ